MSFSFLGAESRADFQAEDAAKAWKRDEKSSFRLFFILFHGQEGRLLSSLQHPFVVRYRDSFCEAREMLFQGLGAWEAGVLCLIMDFCEGRGLLERSGSRA